MVDETHRIDLGHVEPGAWADIKCWRTVGMASEAAKAAEGDPAEFLRKQAELYVVAWSFGERVTGGAFMNLPEHVGMEIIVEARKHYETHMPHRVHQDVRFNVDGAKIVVRALELGGTTPAVKEDPDAVRYLDAIIAGLKAFVAEAEEGKA